MIIIDHKIEYRVIIKDVLLTNLYLNKSNIIIENYR
jgi:hypothetical protein